MEMYGEARCKECGEIILIGNKHRCKLGDKFRKEIAELYIYTGEIEKNKFNCSKK